MKNKHIKSLSLIIKELPMKLNYPTMWLHIFWTLVIPRVVKDKETDHWHIQFSKIDFQIYAYILKRYKSNYFICPEILCSENSPNRKKSLISAEKTCAMFQDRMLFDQVMHSHRMTCM